MSEPTERDQAAATQLRVLAISLAAELRRARRDAYGADHAETADILDEARAILADPHAGQAFLDRLLEAQSELTVARARAQAAETARLAWTEIGAQSQDDARAITRHADELADAVEQEHEMRAAAERDPARRIDLAAASYRLGQALATYRNAQKARS